MKKYIIPEIELVKYSEEDTLKISTDGIQTNGNNNIEFEYGEWNDEII